MKRKIKLTGIVKSGTYGEDTGEMVVTFVNNFPAVAPYDLEGCCFTITATEAEEHLGNFKRKHDLWLTTGKWPDDTDEDEEVIGTIKIGSLTFQLRNFGLTLGRELTTCFNKSIHTMAANLQEETGTFVGSVLTNNKVALYDEPVPCELVHNEERTLFNMYVTHQITEGKYTKITGDIKGLITFGT